MKRTFILVATIVALLLLSGCQSLLIGTEEYSDNGDIEKVIPVTRLINAGEYIDVTDVLSYRSDRVRESDIVFHIDSDAEVSYAVSKESLSSILSEKLVLDEFQELDIDGIVSDMNVGGDLDIQGYISWKYPEKTVKKYKELQQWSYSFDKKGVCLDWDTLQDYVSIGKKVRIDYSFLDDFMKRVVKKYDTFGKPIEFKTRGGKKLTLKGTWGDKVDVDATKASIVEAIKLRKSLEGVRPIFTQETGKLGKNYIEVSISNQTVWLVQDGKVKISSSCVTGTMGKHDTPKGVYFILENKPKGKYLIGTELGDEYKTWVNKWLRITWSGVGLHDASWRGAFGGSIYKSNGSHGCINLPYSFASELCDRCECGFPVVVY